MRHNHGSSIKNWERVKVQSKITKQMMAGNYKVIKIAPRMSEVPLTWWEKLIKKVLDKVLR